MFVNFNFKLIINGRSSDIYFDLGSQKTFSIENIPSRALLYPVLNTSNT